MTGKIYKSAMGKSVDLGALMLANETTRAVGNMNVNARGDVLDSANQVVEPKNRQVQKQYSRQSRMPVTADPVVSRGKSAKASRAAKKESAPVPAPAETPSVAPTPVPPAQSPVMAAAPPVVEESPPAVTEQPKPAPTVRPKPTGGLAAAIARSREIKQEQLKTPRQIAQDAAGVKKI